MDDLSQETKKIWLSEGTKPFSPGGGDLKLDLAFFLGLAFLQTVVLPQIDLGHLKLDCITPWLVLCILRMEVPRAILIFILATLVMETSSSAPSGMYLVVYSMIGITLHVVKPQISWRRTVSWLYAMAAATTLLGVIEGLSLYISEPTRQIGFYALTWGSRVAINCLLIIIVPTHWLSDEWMEER